MSILGFVLVKKSVWDFRANLISVLRAENFDLRVENAHLRGLLRGSELLREEFDAALDGLEQLAGEPE